LLGRLILRQGAEDSTAKTAKYAPGHIGISTKFGNNLIDIATSAEYRASCITLIALETPKKTIQGPGNVSKYLQINRDFDDTPIDHPSLWIGGESVEESRVIKRTKSNVPENCRGYFYFK